MRAAVLVPIKAFSQAKGRLAESLSSDERAILARRMATSVVRAARDLQVFVVTDDHEVAAWARTEGAVVLLQPRPGLDAAVTDSVVELGARGIERVVIAHGDLPFARDLTWTARFGGVTLVPDRRDDGTNVACVPTALDFRFAYGPGSFHRHAAEALRTGAGLRVVRDPRLGWDVDTPSDLPSDMMIRSATSCGSTHVRPGVPTPVPRAAHIITQGGAAIHGRSCEPEA